MNTMKDLVMNREHMRSLFVVLLISLSLHAESLSNQLKHLNIRQQIILTEAYDYGEPSGYGYTMAAIAWQESFFGKFTLNLSDPSCGIMHIMPKYLVKKIDLIDTPWNQSRLCERLIADRDFSYAAALLTLKYWENYWTLKGSPRIWSHTVASYNAGFSYSNGKSYKNAIYRKIKALKSYKGLNYARQNCK